MADATRLDERPVPHFPRGILYGAAAVLAFTVLAAGIGRLAGPSPLVADSQVVSRVDIRFEDRADGSVVAIDAHGGRELERLDPGTNGFMRSTMRGLARERRSMAVGADIPFRLTYWADGRLTLDDSATGRRLELEAFGATNAQAFARLLPVTGAAR